MSKWIIRWNTGYEVERKVIEAENEDRAEEIARKQWLEAVQNTQYGARPYSKELAEKRGLL